MLPASLAASPGAIASMICTLGTEAFEAETLHLLHATSGVEHYTAYRVRGDAPEFIGGASIHGAHAVRTAGSRHGQRSYSDLYAARQALSDGGGAVVVRDDLSKLDDMALCQAMQHYHIVDRVMVCGRGCDDVYAISLLRSAGAGQFADAELDRLSGVAEVVIAAFARHAALHADRSRALAGFDSVEFIESRLRAAGWGLSERELQVSARILYGVSAIGIAIDLGLGEETIATYRKRLYHRLRIGSRHELFQMYLTLL